MAIEFELPDVGEGLTEAEIVEWRVKVGDTVKVNDVLVEIETAKSLVELPSPLEGVVSSLLAGEGETVEVGSAILAIETADSPGPEVIADPNDPDGDGHPGVTSDEFAEAERDTASTVDTEGGANLVGYGTAPSAQSRRNGRRRKVAARTKPATDHEREAAQAAARTKPARPASVPAASAYPIVAKPPIRKLARDLEVELSEVQATGLAGEITRDDVIRHAEQAKLFTNLETPDRSSVREETFPVKGVRKHIAQNMVKSMFTAPHVTLFTDVDATRTMDYVKRLKSSPNFAGVKISPLLLVAKAVIWAIRRNPTVNATWTDTEYTIKHYVNLGIAAATPRGLLVPNIKDAQELSMRELAGALEQLTITARDGKTSPADQQNGTFTITNIGVFGMDSGTPVLMPDEVGIVAFGTVRPKPWVVNDEVQVRQVTTLAASFDHRLVDGDVASRFLADVARIVEEPALLLD
ncbi:dihydrolipoamide acetyltransferase family protein [Gulosibacter molinativorax]|uniref:Dihydrolipoamide acetyltransferase component of pyruvate dehydrogenase complex n=1 Tax=Gulosibacter molinativorax TaxID=256821 RepID=A0ABT7CAF4_9MICO|nr:dihydrolipoamide acetyltransferase family protein [Gulosibacter molinativorax]MDJ1371742.1 2-oxo acid dehydrogenase subunit E2 [Gulosibacter molinativorax]QUY63164.1 Branched-chain alpha-keto acid dehydrogenase subunit E2 [Gulosibacter molinativorax]